MDYIEDTQGLLHGHTERRQHARHTWQCADADKDHIWRLLTENTWYFAALHISSMSCLQFEISRNLQIRWAPFFCVILQA